jgi:hypothetical protein
MGEQRNAVDVGGGGDRKVDRTPTRPAASVAHSGGQASPLPGDVGTDRQRIERGLDRAESGAGTLIRPETLPATRLPILHGPSDASPRLWR